jgi:hypothetical protein
MNINLVYEGQKFQFDVGNNITLEYINQLSNKIFNQQNDKLILYYNNENLLENYDEDTLIREIINDENKNNITFYIKLENNREINIENELLENNENNNENNNQDQYENEEEFLKKEKLYQKIKNKFNILNEKNYQKVIQSNKNFSKAFDNIFERFFDTMNKIKKTIILCNNKFFDYYGKNNYEHISLIFFQNENSKNLELEDVIKFNHNVQQFYENFSYFQIQKNFEINIMNLFKILSIFSQMLNSLSISLLQNNFDNFIKELDNLFELFYNQNFTLLKHNKISLINPKKIIINKSMINDMRASYSNRNLKNIDRFNRNNRSLNNKPFENFTLNNSASFNKRFENPNRYFNNQQNMNNINNGFVSNKSFVPNSNLMINIT